ncbi:uncharacterized protein LOC131149631 [Malania oleifera]|uniref:uncharacterized protein LOC131149631 n=1 Tax=Malania oleifera TaxID=397392 RepID=UPI0025AE647E|nr:uncharacterized protein LOC131149631 [Malania oleifera]
MEPNAGKPNPWKNTLIRSLCFAVLVSILRFAYVVTVRGGSCDSGDFCFFSEPLKLAGSIALIRPSSAVSGGDDPLRDLQTSKRYRATVDYYASVFQDLISEGYLSPDSKALCVGTPAGQDVVALKEIGVRDSIGISKKASPPLVVSGHAFRQPFDENTFDFEFSAFGALDRSAQPVDFAAEVGRTLKPGGFFVAHTVAAKDAYSFNSFLDLFNCCRLIRRRDIVNPDPSAPAVREIVMKKEIAILGSSPRAKPVSKCHVPGYKRDIIRNAEQLFDEEPLKPWITLKRNIKNIKYLPSMVDINFKQRYVYIDIGARNYGSSIGSWFKKQYPKQNKTFEVYAVEADKAFHEEYALKKGVTLLPYAAWVKNETLFFEIRRDPSQKLEEKGRRGMGRIQTVQSSASFIGDVDKIQGFDFAVWLKSVVSEKDFVVVKMDVEGTEFHLIPRLIETGAICLIDEMFLECHYNRWQRCCPGKRSPKYQKTYAQCLDLFSSLRERGVLVHQWW